MLRLIIYGVLFYCIYQVVKNIFPSREERSGRAEKDRRALRGEDLVEDPCCHTYIPVSNACKSMIDGRTVYFCSQKCLDEYRSGKD
jgi:YHS domain-containing protein